MVRAFRRSLVLLSLLGACATPGPPGRPDLLDFLKDGATRRDQVYLALGEPSARYEGERILAYRLKKDERGYVLLHAANWEPVQYSLILVFDGDRLARHSLVDVKPR